MSLHDALDLAWQDLCSAEGFDPAERLQARLAVLNDPQALTATVYRAEDDDPDAEEQDLGEAKVLFQGPFSLPAHWTTLEKDEYLDGAELKDFYLALIECEAKPSAKDFFVADIGDYLAVVDETTGQIRMYFVHDYEEDNQGRRCVLIEDHIDEL